MKGLSSRFLRLCLLGFTMAAAAPAVALAIAPEPKNQLLGLIGVVALAAAWVCTYRFVLGPLSSLAGMADHLTAGDSGIGLDVPNVYGEMGQLAEGLRLTPLSRPQNWKNKVDAPALNIDSQ